jgi:hypothetical protein
MQHRSLLERIGAWIWRIRSSDPDVAMICAAARGDPVDPEALAAAYWRQYYATYRPREEWRALSRSRRGAVYRVRLRLIAAYAGFSDEHRALVADRKPPAPSR